MQIVVLKVGAPAVRRAAHGQQPSTGRQTLVGSRLGRGLRSWDHHDGDPLSGQHFLGLTCTLPGSAYGGQLALNYARSRLVRRAQGYWRPQER